MYNEPQVQNPESEDKPKRDWLPKDEYIQIMRKKRNEAYGMRDNICEEIGSNPASLDRFLSAMVRLDRYSASNALLIYKQCPDATNLKTEAGWTKNEVMLKPDAQPISILEPRAHDGKTYYDVKEMYDVSQTINGKLTPAPTMNSNPRGILSVILKTAPVAVDYVDNFGYSKALAQYSNATGILSVRKNVENTVGLFEDVAFELALAQLSVSNKLYDRDEMNFTAVCIANMICKKYGVPSDRFMITEMPNAWSAKNTKELCAELNKIREGASAIFSRVADERSRQKQEHNKERKAPSHGEAR